MLLSKGFSKECLVLQGNHMTKLKSESVAYIAQALDIWLSPMTAYDRLWDGLVFNGRVINAIANDHRISRNFIFFLLRCWQHKAFQDNRCTITARLRVYNGEWSRWQHDCQNENEYSFINRQSFHHGVFRRAGEAAPVPRPIYHYCHLQMNIIERLITIWYIVVKIIYKLYNNTVL